MLQKIISDKFLEAYKSRDEVRVSVLRLLKSALANKMIEKKMAKEDVLPDEEVMAVIKSEVKKRQDSVVSYRSGGREDLALSEEAEAKILSEFLPEQLGEDQVREIVKATISEMGATPADFGKVMSAAMAKTKGQSDGSIVSKLVKEELSK